MTALDVFLYDTQHVHPIVKLTGLHYATINDASWSHDGRTLAVCSTDGYVTFVRFDEGALGELLPLEEVPLSVKRAYPSIYKYQVPGVSADEIPGFNTSQSPKSTSIASDSKSFIGVDEPTKTLPSKVICITETDVSTSDGIISISSSNGPCLDINFGSPSNQSKPQNSSSTSDNKRKRITPIVITNSLLVNPSFTDNLNHKSEDEKMIGRLGSDKPPEDIMDIQETLKIPLSIVASSQGGIHQIDKKKKRITPVLVANK